MKNPATNTKQFQLSFNFKIAYLLVLAGIATMVFKFQIPALKDRSIRDYLLAVFYLLMIVIIIRDFLSKIITTGNSIIQVTAFKKKEIAIDSIKGFRMEGNTIIIQSLDPSIAAITISGYNKLSGADDLLSWVKLNCKDLDQLQSQNEEIVQENAAGNNQSKQQLKTAKTIADLYNYISIAAAIILHFFYYNKIADTIKLLLPLLGLFIMLLSGHTIRFFPTRGKSISPGVSRAVLVSSFLLLYSAANLYSWVSLLPMLKYVAVIALGFFYIVYTRGRDTSLPFHLSGIVIVSVFALIYAAGAALTINCSFDNSAARPYQSTVIKKYKNAGQNPLRMVIAPWRQGYGESTIGVTEEVYYQREPGQTVEVFERDGLLGVHWFLVTMPVDSLVIPR